jgi:hypothetical protein
MDIILTLLFGLNILITFILYFAIFEVGIVITILTLVNMLIFFKSSDANIYKWIFFATSITIYIILFLIILSIQKIYQKIMEHMRSKKAINVFRKATVTFNKYVRNNFKTFELCLAEVKQKGMAIKYVPDKYITEELCLIAVKQNGMAIEYVPDKYITQELCLIAVKQYCMALKYVPDILKTVEMCVAAVKKNIYVLEYVPAELNTVELCLIAVKQNGITLQYVPDDLKTAELCLAAVKQNVWALQYVPDEHKTEICLTAPVTQRNQRRILRRSESDKHDF